MTRMSLRGRIKYIKSKYNIKGLGIVDPVNIDEVAEKYREGIAEFLSVPVSYIRKDVARKWAEHYVRALIMPEYWEDAMRGMMEAEGEIVKNIRR